MPRFSAHLGYLFADRPLEARFEAARRHGFFAVEHPAPYTLPAQRIAEHLRAHDLDFVQLAAAGDTPESAKGLAGVPGREADFRLVLDRALDYAQEIGCGMVHAMSGVVPPDVAWDDAWRSYIENLHHAAEIAAAANIRLLIEPISEQTVPGFLLCRPELALRALAEVSHPNVFILHDVFHSTVCGTDPLAYLRANLDRIAHIHIADHPGRHEPGTGSIPFAEIFALLDRLLYRGHIGCEYVPAGATEAGLAWLASTNVDAQ